MSLRIIALTLTLPAILTLAACDEDDKKGTPDTSSPADTSVAETTPDPDTTVSDDTGSNPDVASDTVAPDADTDEPDADPDVVDPEPISAVKGARCALSERVGLITIDGSFGALSLNGKIWDRPSPFYGEPVLVDASCSHYAFSPAAPCPADCPDDEVCGLSGTCTKAQLPRTDVSVKLSDGISEQTFTSDAEFGDVYGTPTLTGRSIAIDVTFGGQQVVSLQTDIPADLGDPTGVLEGGYESPTQLTINWTRPNAIIPQPQIDSAVYSLIPINHHAAGPTFTECQVGAGMGVLVVDEPMLTPLAVITGLEFQGIEHVRFAAADTALGCVELRWFVHEYPQITEPATR